MSIPRDRALDLRGSYGIEGYVLDEHLDVMLRHLEIEIVTLRTLPGDLRELYVEPWMLMRHGQGRAWERWNKGHVLGHRFCHVGDQRRMPETLLSWQERQANEFAGWLIFGDLFAEFSYSVVPITFRSLADSARVPVECVEGWWRMTEKNAVDRYAPNRWNYA